MSEKDPIVIHMWCGPRSLSTGTMYSFAQRPDTKVVDEPLYPYWLNQNPDIYRPYKKELFETYSIDGNEILLNATQYLKNGKNIVFMKHIVKQVVGIDRTTFYNKNCKHIFLIRDPLEMILSWDVKSDIHQEECSLVTMGLAVLVDLFSSIRKNTGITPLVVDSNMLKSKPREVLSTICTSLDIPYYEEQLSWVAGPKPEIDGIWAQYWYDKAHTSTGFNSFSTTENPPTTSRKLKISTALTTEQLELYREVLPFYELLHRRAVGVDPLSPGSSVQPKPRHTSTSIVDHGLILHTGSVSSSTPVSTTNPLELLTYEASISRLSDPRNANVLVWVGDRLLPRELAKVSVFDSAVQGGDAVWEGLRVYNNAVFKLEEHSNRLFDSAKAMAFENIPTRSYIHNAIFSTLYANGMIIGGAHIRMTLSRGAKLTSSMNPRFNIFGCCLIILAEWKPVGDMATYNNQKGIRLITACNRRNPPQCVDSKIHHNNLINNILPKIQANNAGAGDALMLDTEGFVSETNATNVFMVKRGVLYTPHADYCLPGVTRQTVIDLSRSLGLVVVERRLSLAEFHAADEVFTTGTMGELTPVYEIDGRQIGYSGSGQEEEEREVAVKCSTTTSDSSGGNKKVVHSITRLIQDAYTTLTTTVSCAIPTVV